MIHALRQVVRDAASTAVAVAVVAALLFAVTGVWPPMVAVESGSMEPHMERGDLVVVSEPARFGADGVAAGVRPVHGAPADSRTLGARGDVIVFSSPALPGTPIIHRAHFYVEDGENWYGEANPAYLPSGVDSCAELTDCPAPYAGFITKGDANDRYDQVNGNSPIVAPDRIRSEARVAIPLLGHIRLALTGA
ncbi:S26 family signal peptidase [Halobaculum gomorrense]|uniref:Signal peptidase, endoplasmic reticulum-type n=1 Tax=Halobaculum gomorrense TaxID=43928 RepID=A0A1M5KPK5_9EURY|nr:S26 family signal peptidase [Halobaculum gomorrense]SHG54691.1 signal peptidase, endoplasmic reticulum-type [Halobaculum gomorrense]